jgi:hypothetical protein
MMQSKHRILLAVLGLALASATLAYAQAPSAGGEPGPYQNVISALNIWVSILSLMVTTVIGLTAFGMVYHYRQADDTRKSLVTDYEKRVLELEKRYNLSALKRPDEILGDARKEYESLLAELRRLFISEVERLERTMKGAESQLSRFESEMTHSLSEVRGEIAGIVVQLGSGEIRKEGGGAWQDSSRESVHP